MAPPAESAEITIALSALRDVQGVGGSFYVDPAGALLGHDMPAYFDNATLEEAGPRALRLFEVWPADVSGGDCVVRFDQCRLYFRGNGHGLLCVLLVALPHMNSLRTAAELVGRRLAELPTVSLPASNGRLEPVVHTSVDLTVGGVPRTADRSASTTSTPPPAAMPAQVQETSRPRRVRIYRGQRFEY